MTPSSSLTSSRPPTPRTRSTRARSSLVALGPSLLIAAGCVDPGNWGADVAAGAQFGHRLMWVLGAATLAALLLQQVSARLGLATGRDLASLIATALPRPLRRGLIPPILAALAVTEVVEVLGVVIGVQLLTGWGLEAVPVAAALVVLAVAAPGRFGRGAVYGCLALVGVVYLGVVALGGGGEIAGGLRPAALPPGALPVAVAMIGAIVMPHNILLHSTLARDLPRSTGEAPRRLLRRSFAATAIALLVRYHPDRRGPGLVGDRRDGQRRCDGRPGAAAAPDHGAAAAAVPDPRRRRRGRRLAGGQRADVEPGCADPCAADGPAPAAVVRLAALHHGPAGPRPAGCRRPAPRSWRCSPPRPRSPCWGSDRDVR